METQLKLRPGLKFCLIFSLFKHQVSLESTYTVQEQYLITSNGKGEWGGGGGGGMGAVCYESEFQQFY